MPSSSHVKKSQRHPHRKWKGQRLVIHASRRHRYKLFEPDRTSLMRGYEFLSGPCLSFNPYPLSSRREKARQHLPTSWNLPDRYTFCFIPGVVFWVQWILVASCQRVYGFFRFAIIYEVLQVLEEAVVLIVWIDWEEWKWSFVKKDTKLRLNFWYTHNLLTIQARNVILLSSQQLRSTRESQSNSLNV